MLSVSLRVTVAVSTIVAHIIHVPPAWLIVYVHVHVIVHNWAASVAPLVEHFDSMQYVTGSESALFYLCKKYMYMYTVAVFRCIVFALPLSMIDLTVHVIHYVHVHVFMCM